MASPRRHDIAARPPGNTWRPRRPGVPRGAVALAVGVLLCAAAAPAARAGPVAQRLDATALLRASAVPAAHGRGPAMQRLDATVRYLQSVQNLDGGFGGRRGAASDPLFTSWAALALAATGINPRDQALPGGRDALSYLRRTSGRLSLTTDFERTLMVAVAAGVDARRFGGRDLIAPIVARQLPDGSFPQAPGGAAAVNATAFAVIALSQVGETGLEARIQRAATWLEQVAGQDGGYSWLPRAPGGADMTAAVIEALRAAGRAGTPAERRAFAFLRSLQNDDGGFPATAGDESNSPSTAWALQALWAAGRDPRRWAKPGGTPLDFLAAMQQADGSVRQSATQDPNRVWVTAYAAPALAGRPLPIAPVPRAQRAPAPDRKPQRDGSAPSRARTEPGDDEEPGGGVVYGGGGAGAPLFSRPRPDGDGKRPAVEAGEGGGRRRVTAGGAGDREARTRAPRPDATTRTVERAGDRRARARASGRDATTRTVEGAVIGADAPGAGGGHAPRLRSAGDDHDPTVAGVLVLAGLGVLALAGGLVERRRT